jgi:hypothetical protein
MAPTPNITQYDIQSQSSNIGFIHLALPNAASHIRLIQVRKAETDLLQCEISTWPVVSVPAYRAISYTWGDPTSTETISLNGQQIEVCQNCAYALRQAYWHEQEQYA